MLTFEEIIVQRFQEVAKRSAGATGRLTFEEIILQQVVAEYAERNYAKGYKEGFERGCEEILVRWRALLLRQLGRRFGAVPEGITGRVAQASIDDLERWGDRLLDAASLDELFAS